MIKPCAECKHSELKSGIAGSLWCKKKSKLCSLARITSEDGDKKKDCFAEAAAQREVAEMTPAVTA